jgi:hypothetical protein
MMGWVMRGVEIGEFVYDGMDVLSGYKGVIGL